MFELFKRNKNELDFNCQNHFSELRRKLDLHRENLKEKIDDIYIEMIEATKEYETSYLKRIGEKFDTSIKAHDTKTLADKLKEMQEKFRDPNLSIELIQDMQLNQEGAMVQLETNLK